MAAAEVKSWSRHTPRGLLRIDAATPVMLSFLMPLIKPFRERYPEALLVSLDAHRNVHQCLLNEKWMLRYIQAR